jgi:hypothetical protein
MASRAARIFPQSRIMVLSSTAIPEPDASAEHETREAEKGTSLDVNHISTVVELLGNLKVQKPAPVMAETVDERPGLPAGTPA